MTRRLDPLVYKKFDGTGDPYDHIAQYKQLIFAEGVSDMHTMVQGLGLTMEGRALAWFQTLKPSTLYDFETLVKSFIEAYSKIGIKHNTLSQILNFKQKEKESVRECADRMRQYIVRCPKNEMPSQERLVSSFIEGLQDRQLCMHLFARNHTNFEECCFDAQKFVDNCDFFKQNGDPNASTSDDSNQNLDINALADLIINLLRQDSRLTTNFGRATKDREKWCNFCAKWTSHEGQECQNRVRHLRERVS